jgi:hypothetical protein
MSFEKGQLEKIMARKRMVLTADNVLMREDALSRKSQSTGSADDFRKIRRCIGLLNSMVRGGERHSDTSERMTAEALEALERMEQPND